MKKYLIRFAIIFCLFINVLLVTSCEDLDNFLKNGHLCDYCQMGSDEENHWKICSICGNTKGKENHTFTKETIILEPTCFSYGTKEYKCEFCDVTAKKEIAKISHTYGDWEANGDTHKRKCLTVGCISEEITTHQYNSGEITKEASCIEEGVKTYTCKTCQGKKNESIAMVSHTFGKWEANGDTHKRRCLTVGCSEEIIEAHEYDESQICLKCADLGHTHNYVTVIFNETKHWKECSCGDKIEETLHQFNLGETTKEASCTEEGNKKYTCETCAYSKNEKLLKLGHEFSSWQINEKTHIRVCKNVDCGLTEEKAHDYDITKTCKICQEHTHYYAEFINNSSYHWGTCACEKPMPKVEHHFDAGVITREATCYRYGNRRFTCLDCNYIKDTYISGPPHNFGPWQTKEDIHYKLCQNQGCTFGDYVSHKYIGEGNNRTCEICGKVKPENELDYSYNNSSYSDVEIVIADVNYSVVGIGTVTSSTVNIPSTHLGKNVNYIERLAFSNIDFITRITIPNTIKDIHSSAFYGCMNLMEVQLEYYNTLALDIVRPGHQWERFSAYLGVICEPDSNYLIEHDDQQFFLSHPDYLAILLSRPTKIVNGKEIRIAGYGYDPESKEEMHFEFIPYENSRIGEYKVEMYIKEKDSENWKYVDEIPYLLDFYIRIW